MTSIPSIGSLLSLINCKIAYKRLVYPNITVLISRMP